MATDREQEMADAIARAEDVDDLATDDGPHVRPLPPRRAAADVYTFRLHHDRREQLRASARRHGIPPATLIRQWVEERLDAENGIDDDTAGIAGVGSVMLVDESSAVLAADRVRVDPADLALQLAALIDALDPSELRRVHTWALADLLVHIGQVTVPTPVDITVGSKLASAVGQARLAEAGPGESRDRHVLPHPDGGWDVRAPGARRASAHTATQDEAIRRARAIVRNAGGGEVVVHRRDGTVRSSDSVGPEGEAGLQRSPR